MTTAPTMLTAIGSVIDTVAAVRFAEFHDALAADGVAADTIADLEAFFLAEYIAWRQEALAALEAEILTFLEPPVRH